MFEPLPSSASISAALQQRLEEAYHGRSAYQARSRNLREGQPRFCNRLILESSPYLLQHAHNPVDWYPWCDEAFERAAAEQKPVFLSVGYATCHWCHVMEHESFESVEIAAQLNRDFVCVKVDREERPDVDSLYMGAVQVLSGRGGWPMSVWLDPQRRPFFAATYLPPHDGQRGAAFGFVTLLQGLARTYREEPQRVAEAAAQVVEVLRRSSARSQAAAQADPLSLQQLERLAERAVEQAREDYDPVHGGRRGAPKFPSSFPIRMLLRHALRSAELEAFELAGRSLEAMACGGIYDQLGGGFHRYSTDERWRVPHFEKMLYDNALLSVAYLEAIQLGREPRFASDDTSALLETFERVVLDTLDFVRRELALPGGGFASAFDADSEGEEGRYYLWEPEQVDAVLGEAAPAFLRAYVDAKGAAEAGKVLHLRESDELAWRRHAPSRARLLAARALRPPPLRDDKLICAWNAYTISALAKAGVVLERPDLLDLALGTEAALRAKLCVEGLYRRSHAEGRASAQVFLEDQTAVCAALLDVYDATWEPDFLERAIALAAKTEAVFGDREHGSWFLVPEDSELLVREKPEHDGAEPAPSSLAIDNALRLAAYAGDALGEGLDWRGIAERGLRAQLPLLSRYPQTGNEAMVALFRKLMFESEGERQVLVVWSEGAQALAAACRSQLGKRLRPGVSVLGAREEELERLGRLCPWVRGKTSLGAGLTVYVCAQGRCEAPLLLSTAAQLSELEEVLKQKCDC
ncbi:MAG: thioredoxin domain-containing protein [Myxococcota bacterium]|jgi:uncharacterized protein YyaL (SSP411 family)|nr:thioredoxin domain-containing protein [Myxococcota bacterium]